MNLGAKSERIQIFADRVKWLLVGVLILAAVVANYYFSDQATSFRIVWNLVVVIAMLMFASFTEKGKLFWAFAKEAKIELRKVVWPTRQETVQSTIVIVVVVTIAALFLWGVDSVLLWGMGFVTGQRG